MYKYLFLFAFIIGTTTTNALYAAAPKTTCVLYEVYTSCNAGYYLSSRSCKPCPVGTYKSASGTQTSCTTCPSSGGIAGTTKSTGSTAITQCYLPAGSSSSDSGGKYEYTGDCYYKS